jgi:hypothetical protein
LHANLRGILDINDSGSLSSLILKGNRLATREAGAALGSMLKTCTSLTALDVSENGYYQCDGPGFASEIASGLKDAKGSLSSANLLGNSIGVEQAQVLLKIKEAKPGLTTLCGLSGDETELDLSGKKLGPGCAILLAPDMEANGSLSKLDLSGNKCFGYKDKTAIKALAGAIKASSISDLNLAGNDASAGDAPILAEAIQAMGSLSKLKMGKYELPVQEIKTATELDLSNKGLGELDAIVIAVLITVCKLQNRFVTNWIAYRPFHVGQWVVVQVGFEQKRHGRVVEQSRGHDSTRSSTQSQRHRHRP